MVTYGKGGGKKKGGKKKGGKWNGKPKWNENFQNKDDLCNYCKQPGHWKNECPSR